MATFTPQAVSFDTILDFTRGSTGAYFDSDGVLQTAATDEPRFDYDPVTGEALGLLIEEARTNLLSYPRRFDNSVWAVTRATVVANTVSAPDGTITAEKLVEDLSASTTHLILTAADTAVTDGSRYVTTIYAKAGERTWFQLQEGQGVTASAYFDLSNGSVGTVSGTGSPSASITAVLNGWYRCTLSWTASGTAARVRAYLATGDGFTSYTGDGTSGIYIWHAQLEQGNFASSTIPDATSFTSRSTTATFLDSAGIIQTAGVDVARDDAYGYDSAGVLQPIGLLLEDEAENLTLYSEDFSDSVWGKQGTVVTADTIASPDSNSTTDLVKGDGVSSSKAGIFQEITSVTGGTKYTWTCYAKPETANWIRFGSFDGVTAPLVYFDVENGVIGSFDDDGGAGYDSASITKAANGFYRCEATRTIDGSATSVRHQINSCFSDGLASNGTDELGIYLWGAQLEEGNYATSYIRTTTAAVTRAADVSSSPQATRSADDCSRTLGAEFNADEFSFFVDFDYESSGGGGFSIDAGISTARIQVRRADLGEVTVFIQDQDGSTGATFTTSGNALKVAASFSGTTALISVNGESASRTIGEFSTQLDTLRIGNLFNGNFPTPKGVYRDVRLYLRALTATELQELTAP